MTKEFIPYEQSLALKELGFDEPCLMMYDTKEILYSRGSFGNHWTNNDKGLLTAPLYQQVFRWFREKHNLVYTIGHIGHTDSWTFATENLQVAGQEWSKHYSTYEEAELECLKQLIKVVKEKT